jgi:Heterokaryon incompatibility protein (HET)
MRLLQCSNNGDLTLTEFFESAIPQYAILSHRWGTEEVTFKDLLDGKGKSRTGYGKIQFCGEQARRDGLQYFWVDTCCIDKSNSTELAEAINSMFRWYQEAVRCYVYLSDVSTLERKASDTSTECIWESDFRNSEWFTRGWTLQELLAPRSVEFFSREGKPLGDKRTLKQHIQEITGIPVSALEGAPLFQFRVEERLSWAENRQTTRGEDKAYSLLGLFGIHLPLIYGEGEEHAFKRLKKEIQNSLPGEHTINRFIFSCMLISLCKKTSRIYSTPRVEAAYRTYGQQIHARTRSGSRIQRAGYYEIPTSGSSNIPISNNGVTTNRADYSGSRAIPGKARQC